MNTPTCFSLIYFDFLVLHPSHKLAYFGQAGWKEEWRVAAEEIVQTEFERSYAGIDIQDSNDAATVSHSIILHCVVRLSANLLGYPHGVRQYLRCLAHSFCSNVGSL